MLQAAGINFEKLLGWTVFKNPNFNPFQFSLILPIRDICFSVMLLKHSLKVLSGYFYVSLNLTGIL